MIREKLDNFYSYVFEKELLDEIEQVGVYKKLRENELLVDLGDQMKGVPLLLDGAIKIVREDKKGEEILLYFLEKGDTCASSFASAISNGKCGIRAIAEKESEIIFLPKEKLDEWLVKYKSWRNFVIDSYNIRLNEMMETIDTLAFMRMDERLYKYLTDKAQIMRETSLNTTHQDIAYDMHTSRVVISRLLKQLENEGKIKLHRNKIEILEF
ncbi:Crp/Fnr family transcriptional regulator [Lutibacter flavus]|uniref:CRP/FNR family transcriptional regulator, anaerobic regulatory protein n=1 Tax=Lutibacter flavus TaxID=691689 RepID=A0A238X9P0_9FLAO|nr:Crp/Fnr family transcriptional regulator [Lutibacter flavus]SNR55765.1 CRP/FNR family transcriptional regulator, anaerobic regulatory protein [Lutibacter flavus]